MGVQRKHVNELCNARRKITAPTALILARVFGNSADFWLNVQRRTDLWEAMRSPRERIRRAKPLRSAAERPETRSEEHTSELQSLMRISYAVFCLKKKKQK